MIKRISVIFALFLMSVSGLFAQQITRIAVIDTARVYQAYFRNSAPVRNLESKKADYQSEIDSLTQELKELHNKRLEYENIGDTANAAKVKKEITAKSKYLTEYASAKNAELEALKDSLENNDDFYSRLNDTVEAVAENGGYSVVMSLQQANAILWYSSSVDITDDVITKLGL